MLTGGWIYERFMDGSHPVPLVGAVSNRTPYAQATLSIGLLEVFLWISVDVPMLTIPSPTFNSEPAVVSHLSMPPPCSIPL